MNKKWKVIRNFLFSYLLVLIPLLVVSLWNSTSTINSIKNENQIKIQIGTDQARNDLNDLFVSYFRRSASLAAEHRLYPHFWNDNAMRLEAIETIKRISSYDLTCERLFLHHTKQGIWSSDGYSTVDTYLRKTLNLTNDSIERIATILPNYEKTAIAVSRSNAADKGYVFLHYPMSSAWSKTEITVNYLIDYQVIAKYLRGISPNCKSYIRLGFVDGSFITYTYDGHDLHLCEAFSQEQVQDFTLISSELPFMQVSLSVYFDSHALYASLLSGQGLMLVLLMLGILASMAITFLLCTRKVMGIKLLDSIANGEDVDFCREDEFAYAGSLLRKSVVEVKALSTLVEQHSDTIRRQKIRLILAGGIKKRALVEEFLRSCNVAWNEEYYYVGCIQYHATVDVREDILKAIRHKAACFAKVAEKEGVVWFGDMPTLDHDQQYRLHEAQQMKALLESAGAQDITIGISREYKDIQLITFACQEAEQSLLPGNIQCYEALPRSYEVFRLDQNLLSCFSSAVRSGNQKKAQESFDEMETSAIEAGCSEKNYVFVRMTILQTLLLAITENENTDDRLIHTVMEINIQDAELFRAQMTRFLRKNVQAKDRSQDFQLALTHIQEHFNDPNLSAEQVAEIAGLSRINLARLFKSEIGKTYIEYLSDIRLEHAKKLLITTDIPITEIARMIGYFDRSTLYRKFKSKLGMDMSEYRAMFQPRTDEE